jgi:hypothetical protein
MDSIDRLPNPKPLNKLNVNALCSFHGCIPKVNLFPLLRFVPGDVFCVQQCTDQNHMVREGIQKYIDEHNATLNEDDVRDFIDAYPYLLNELRKMVWFIVCNGTFSNISVIS